MRLLLPLLLAACGTAPSGPGGDRDDTDAPDSDVVPGDTDTGPTGDSGAPCPTFPPGPPLPASALGSDGGFRAQVLGSRFALCLAVDDLDGDGRTDLLALYEGGPSFDLEVRWGDGTPTPTPVTTAVTPGDVGLIHGCTLADVDGDHDLDLLLATSHGATAVLAGPGRTWSVGGEVLSVPSTLAAERRLPEMLALIDLDHQGPLDLVWGAHGLLMDSCPDPDAVDTGDLQVPAPAFSGGPVRCYVADGQGAYVDAPAGLCPDPVLATPTVAPYGALVGDLDHDGHTDLLLTTDFATNRLLRGTASGLVPAPGRGLDVYDHGMGVAQADFDGDGQLDVYITDLGPDSVYLGQCGTWFDAGQALGWWAATARSVTWGVAATDVDHDGAPDLIVGVSADARGAASNASMCIGPTGLPFPHPATMLLHNDGTGHMTRHDLVDRPGATGKATGLAARVAVGDLDGDLDVDAVVGTGRGVSILWNDVTKAGPVLRVRPVDDHGLPAVGARVVLQRGDHRRLADLWRPAGYSGPHETVAHLPLGQGTGEVTVEVRWPDGRTSTHGPYAAEDAEVVVSPPSAG
ncbi:MAG: CRTAC1 family protein [Alphaproteobacteria bacterium]|nr:CRTAC1 family protein [Alphaproteobacteria bacterium]